MHKTAQSDTLIIAIFAALMLAWTIAVTVSQHMGFVEWQRQQEAYEESTVLVGNRRVDKQDYESAQVRWREAHPEPTPNY